VLLCFTQEDICTNVVVTSKSVTVRIWLLRPKSAPTDFILSRIDSNMSVFIESANLLKYTMEWTSLSPRKNLQLNLKKEKLIKNFALGSGIGIEKFKTQSRSIVRPTPKTVNLHGDRLCCYKFLKWYCLVWGKNDVTISKHNICENY